MSRQQVSGSSQRKPFHPHGLKAQRLYGLFCNYWNKLAQRLREEGAEEVLTECQQLKLPANDGKSYKTACASTETVLRIVQSIPSPKAEPFKQWLAQLGAERLEEIADPEAALLEWKERAIRSYMAQGYSEEYAKIRVDSIIVRNALTGEWAVRDIKPEEFPILTNQLHMGSFDISIQQHMGVKNYPIIRRSNKTAYKGELRKGLTPLELTVAMFDENLSRSLHIERDSHGFAEISRDVDDAARLARQQRLQIEQLTGKPVVSPINMQIQKDGGLWSLLPPPNEEGEEA